MKYYVEGIRWMVVEAKNKAEAIEQARHELGHVNKCREATESEIANYFALLGEEATKKD
jgi:hypothetical protein